MHGSLRICLVTPEFAPYGVGGIGTYVRVLAHELSLRGHRVDVLGCDIIPEGLACERTESHGRVISLSPARHWLGGSIAVGVERAARRWYHRGWPGMWRAYPYISTRPNAVAAILLKRFVAEHGRDYDVIEYPNWSSHAAWLPPADRPAYITRLSTSSAYVPGWHAVFGMERKAVRSADAVITHSEAMAREGEAIYSLRPGSIHFVSLGLLDAPIERPQPNGPFSLVSVGRAEDRKGTDILLQAMATVLPRCPDVRFTFVGAGLEGYVAQRPALHEPWRQLAELGGGRFRSMGQLEDSEKEREVGRSHWLVMPSRFESFGLVAVEAMRLGTPVIFARGGGLADVGSRSFANIAVEPGDVMSLVQGIRHAIEGGAEAALAARGAARTAFERCFSSGEMAERTLDVYRNVLESRASVPRRRKSSSSRSAGGRS